MKTLNLLVAVFAVIAMAVSMTAFASAVEFTANERVTVNGIENFGGTAAVFAGETVPVRVIFTANANVEDVRVTLRLRGHGGFSEVSREIDVLANGQYSVLLNAEMPFDLDERDENLSLVVTIESRDSNYEDYTQNIPLAVQRDKDVLEILSVSGADEIRAGQTLALDIVLKNRGRDTADDNYVRATIPELGVSTVVYFSDLTPVDDFRDLDKEDAIERRAYLNIPRSARAGVYTVQLEAYNSDTTTMRTKRIVVTGAGAESRVLSSMTTKTFAAGESKAYSVTIVNAGNEIKAYDLIVEAPEGLSVTMDDTLVVVPAGSSKTVEMTVVGSEEGTHNFAVTVQSDGEIVKRENFGATIQGTKATQLNASVVLTVVLAVIFVVLVIVLIVLLTRKPAKSEEYGESYY